VASHKSAPAPEGSCVIAADSRGITLERIARGRYKANVPDARAVICAFDSDSLNILIAITAREMRQQAEGARFRALVRVEDEENIDKARGVGGGEVISPSTSAGRLMASEAIEASSS